MSQPYKSGRQQNLNLGITSVTESTTVLQTIGKVGIGTTNAQNHSLFVVGSTNITGDVNVGGASTFVGVGTFGNSLYVANQLYVGGVNITGGATVGADITTRNLLASGISTLTGQVNANGGLNVTGHTELDNVNVSGVSTFAGLVDANGGADISGQVTLNNTLSVTGVSTFTELIDSNGGLDVTGHTELDNVNVSGIITTTSLDVLTNFDVYDTQAVFHNNVRIDGNLSIGGTTTVIAAQDLKVFDKDIILGIATDAFGNDISNDITANHGGIAVASTVGSPLIDLALVGFSTLPATYKQLMWVAADSYGIGTTDAWMFNYAVGVGSTLVPNGVRFAVKGIQFTDDSINTPNINASQNLNVSGTSTLGITSISDLYVSGVSTFVGVGTFNNDLYVGKNLYVKNNTVTDTFTTRNLNVTGITTVGVVSAISINATGIITANSFRPSSGFIQAADGTNSFYIYNGSGNVAFQGTIGASSINNGQGYQAINFTTNATPTVLIPNDLNVTGLTTLSSAGGITTTGGDLYVGGDLYIKDDLFLDEFTARNARVTGVTTLGFTTTGQLYAANFEVAGVATFRGNAYFGDTDVLYFGDGNDLQVFHDGSNSYVRETGVGSLVLASDGVGVDVYNVAQGEYQARFINNGAVELYHDNIKRLETTGYGITVYNTIQASQINITGVGTISGVSISSGIVTSSNPGVTTIQYYGDGSNLFGVNAFNVVNQVLSASPVYPTFANNIGVTSIGISPTEMGYIPSSGNLGIGSTNPTAKLQVVGDVLISGVITAVTGNFSGIITSSGAIISGVSTVNGKITAGNQLNNINLSNTLNYNSSSGITAFRPISLVDSAAGIKISRNAGTTNGAAIELQTWDVGIVTNYSYWDVNAENGYFGIRDRKKDFTRIFIDDSGSILLGANSATFSNNYSQLVGIGTDKLLNVLGNSYISGSVGIGTTNPTEQLQVNGNISIDGNVSYGTTTATTTSTSQVSIHSSFDISAYRSVEYTIQATEGSNFHTTKILALHDGTNAYHTEYGTIFNNVGISTYDVDVSAGKIRLRATPISSSTTNFKVVFNGIKV